MATKSTKVTKGTLKSASGRGDLKVNDVKVSGAKTVSTGKEGLKAVSGRGDLKAYDAKVGGSKTVSVGKEGLKAISGRGGKECEIAANKPDPTDPNGSGIKVKVPGADLKKGTRG